MTPEHPPAGPDNGAVALAIHAYFNAQSRVVPSAYVDALIPRVRAKVLELSRGQESPTDRLAVAEALNHLLGNDVSKDHGLGNVKDDISGEVPEDDFGNRL